MNRIDRVLALFHQELSAEQARQSGVTARDMDDAVNLAMLDLELTRAYHRLTLRDYVDDYYRSHGDDA